MSSSSRNDNVKQLYDAISKGEWDDVERLLSGENKVKAFATRLTERGETALLVAITEKREFFFVQKLIDLMPPELLWLTDYDGNTALHKAENSKDGEIYELLMERNHRLERFRNRHGRRIEPYPYVDDLPNWSEEVRKAVTDCDWNSMERLMYENSITSVFTGRLTQQGTTALNLAVSEKRNIEFIRKMVDSIMPQGLLALTDYHGNTALHHAALVGYEEAAKLLVEKMPELLNFYNQDCYLPIQLACKQGHFKIAENLLNAGIENNSYILLQRDAGRRAMQYLVHARFYDLALKLFERKPELALDEVSYNGVGNCSGFELIAEDPAAFPSGTFFTSIWDSFIYSNYPKMPSKIQKVLKFLEVPSMKNIREANLKHHDAIKLVKCICEHIKKNIESGGHSYFLKKPFLAAARNGIQEIVTEILNSFPNALEFTDDDHKHSIFHLAVKYRNEKIFNIARHKSTEDYKKFLLLLDGEHNNVLHLAGEKACQVRLDLKPRPILQMQSEVKWFKVGGFVLAYFTSLFINHNHENLMQEIEKLVTPLEIKSMNNAKKTPLTVFNEEHADLAKKEIKWVTGMASACSVAASLIATVAFTAAITVAGGNDDDKDLFYYYDKSPLVFAISDALALFASITSVLTFLSIFTSRYEVNDFLYQLPNRLIIGLISLFLSVINLMIAFRSTVLLLFPKKSAHLLIAITTFSCVPIILYAFIQLPSLINMMTSTYGPELLRPRNTSA